MTQFSPYQRTLGVWFSSSRTAHVCLWAPAARAVALRLNQATTLPLRAGPDGYWLLETGQVRPGDSYQFVLDNGPERPDPVSLAQPNGVHGASVAVDTGAFDWTDAPWQNPDLADYVLYELHVGTFTPDGTFAAIEAKLDHLVELGVTAVELMPVAQFPGERNWGYDGVYPFAAQHSYGGAAGLQRLVDACHRRGLAVVLDVVYNHLGPEGNYLGQFGPYFTDRYQTPWGPAVNFDGPDSAGVRRYFIENALMWLRDFHIDALRLDAVHAFVDASARHILRELRHEVDRLMAHTGRRHYLIVELELNEPRYINPPATDGYGMDAQWLDGFHHALRIAAGGEAVGYYTDYNGVDHLAKAYRDAYVYDGQVRPSKQRAFGQRATHNTGQQFVVFTQNHDQVGNRMHGERPSALFSVEMQKLMAGAVLLSPYLPMLFMGEEWGETAPFQYFVSHTDPALIEAVQAGRRREFAALHVDGVVPDAFAVATFRRSKLHWDQPGQEPHRTLLNYYKTLLTLRKTHPVLRRLDRQQLTATANADQQTLLLHRWHHNAHVACLMNFSADAQFVPLPTGVATDTEDWQLLLNSADARWTTHAHVVATAAPSFVDVVEPNATTFAGGSVLLAPESICIFHHSS